MKIDSKLRDKLEYLNEIAISIVGIAEDLDCFEDSKDGDQYVTTENLENLAKAYFTIACHAEDGYELANHILGLLKEQEEAKNF